MAALLEANDEDLAYVRALYRAAVAETDLQVARFVRGLEEAGLDDRTIVAVTSSNGEGFRPDLKRVHHGGRLHHDVLHVPLVVRWPGHLEPGVEGSMVTILDVGPTLLALAGLPQEPLFTGRALVTPETGLSSRLRGPRFRVGHLEARDAIAEEATFRILPSGVRAAATGVQLALYRGWITLIDTGPGAELYDLKDDPEQERDLAAEHAEGVARLQERVRQIAAQGAKGGARPDAEELGAAPGSLGYVQ